ncbi:MAG: hypothetical protein AAB866_02875 [Patescibacteria group bacterium]
MNKKTIIAIAIALVALPVFAQTSSTTPLTKAQTQRLEKGKTNGNREINRRVEGLNKLINRINEMKHIDDNQKSSLVSSIQGQISPLQALKTKIDNDENEVDLKTDVKSITDSYRIYALVIPQGQVIASADKLFSLVETMIVLGTKIQTQITQAQTNGQDITAVQTLFADYNLKLADAKTQVQAVISSVAGFIPDNGDKTKMQENNKALKDAREKLKIGEKDIRDARKDVEKITKALRNNKEREASTTAPKI